MNVNPPISVAVKHTAKVIHLGDTILIALENGKILRVPEEDKAAFEDLQEVTVEETFDSYMPYKTVGLGRVYYLIIHSSQAETWLLIKSDPRIFQIVNHRWPYLKLINSEESIEVVLSDKEGEFSGDYVVYVDVLAQSNKGRGMYAGALLFFFKTEEEALQWFDPMNTVYQPGYWAQKL